MKLTIFRSTLKLYDYVINMELSTILISTILAFYMAMLNLVNTYLFNDWTYATFFVLLFVLNTFSGVYKAVRKRDISFSVLFWGILDRAVAYVILFPVAFILINFPLSGEEPNVIFTWLRYIVYVGAMGYEGQQVFSNVSSWLPSLFRTAAFKNVFKYFRGYNEQGEKI